MYNSATDNPGMAAILFYIIFVIISFTRLVCGDFHNLNIFELIISLTFGSVISFITIIITIIIILSIILTELLWESFPQYKPKTEV